MSLAQQNHFGDFERLMVLKSMATMSFFKNSYWWQSMTSNMKLDKLHRYGNLLSSLQQIIFSNKNAQLSLKYTTFFQDLEQWDQLGEQNEFENVPTVSKFQRQVFSTLQALGYDPLPEHPIGSQVDGTTDIALLDVGGHKVAIEVDGQFHFARNPPFLPLGNTVVRTKVLEGCGWQAVRVNAYEWSEAYKKGLCEQLLEDKILEKVGAVVLGEEYISEDQILQKEGVVVLGEEHTQ
eukprot:TRINITY_DN2427_c0_g1_i3.p1 TRINITY_DN2427_c0_g1~~TRINITY_DN2427_c0_g1_i3.p1  ORF type:complete len:247 (+),score=31.33 TRINITY_DN2427_c0_g1_i3:35-742(+)